MNLGTLINGLGCFPFDNEAYPPLSDSRISRPGIRSLFGVGTPVRALVHSVLYPHDETSEASPKAISESTSYLQV